MFLAERFRAVRVLSVAAAGTMVATTALVAAAPAHAAEIYPRPWDNTVTLSGHGWGHGHGMSQYGAYGAAVQGRTWQQIVDFYYPGTTGMALPNTGIRVLLSGVGSAMTYVQAATGLTSSASGSVALPTVAPDGTAVAGYRPWPVAASGTAVKLQQFYAGGWHDCLATGAKPCAITTSVDFPVTFANNGTGFVATSSMPGAAFRPYRGVLVSHKYDTSPKTFTSVNVLPMESYLLGVVPKESPASWPVQALAAQAVAARTYAAQARDGLGTYDICDTTACQVYGGKAAEDNTYNASAGIAATQTRSSTGAVTGGTILTSLGKPAFTEFGSSNGGWSADGGKPYLIAQADPFDVPATDPVHTWSASVPVPSIEARWPSIGTYRELRIVSRDGHGQWGGRVLSATIVGSAASVTIKGTDFQTAFGLKSEWFIPTNLRSAPSYPRDLSGDHLADVLGVVAGTGDLRMYPGNGASGWKPMQVIGTAFGGFSKVFTAGTWDTDALSDVMAQRPDGTLWLYPGTTAGPVGPPRQVGAGWGVFNLVFPVGDFGGDGLSDLLARTPDGALMLYSGNGAGGFLNNTRQIGTGWGVFTSVFSPGDFTGDGKADVIARTSDGLLYVYPGNGSGGWLPRRLIGQGWNGFSVIMSSGDFSGDGKSDLLGRRTDGTLWMYPGNGTGGFLPAKGVGSGWNIFSTVLP